jgi:hypothetical protein
LPVAALIRLAFASCKCDIYNYNAMICNAAALLHREQTVNRRD